MSNTNLLFFKKLNECVDFIIFGFCRDAMLGVSGLYEIEFSKIDASMASLQLRLFENNSQTIHRILSTPKKPLILRIQKSINEDTPYIGGG